MVTQNTLRTYEAKQHLIENKFQIQVCCQSIKCLQQVESHTFFSKRAHRCLSYHLIRYLSTLELFWVRCMTLTFIPGVNFDTKQGCQYFFYSKKSLKNIIFFYFIDTLCPGSSYPNLYSNSLYKLE